MNPGDAGPKSACVKGTLRGRRPPNAISRRLNGFFAVASSDPPRAERSALRPAPRSRTSQDRRRQAEGQDEDAQPRRGDGRIHLWRELRFVRPLHFPVAPPPRPTPARRVVVTFSPEPRRPAAPPPSRPAAASRRIHLTSTVVLDASSSSAVDEEHTGEVRVQLFKKAQSVTGLNQWLQTRACT